MIYFVSQWEVWICRFRGFTSYHASEEDAAEQLRVWRKETPR